MLTVAARASVPLFVVSAAVATTALVTQPRTVPVVLTTAPVVATPTLSFPAPIAPPAIATACAADPARVGDPLVNAQSEALIDGVATSLDGCTIAAWTATTLELSWDGGVTFTAFATQEPIRTVAVSDQRATVIAGRNIGFVAAGGRVIAWHAPVDAVTHDTWSVLIRGPHTLVQGDGWTGITDDEGWTWRTLASPPEVATDLGRTEIDDIVGDVVHATGHATIGEPGMEALRYVPHAFTFSLADAKPTWRKAAVPTAAWTYEFVEDEFWGCGGTEMLVAKRHGQQRVLEAGLNGMIAPSWLVTTPRATFAQLRGALHRLDAGRAVVVAPADPAVDIKLVAIDGYGLPLFIAGHQLVRWSESGGYRALTTL